MKSKIASKNIARKEPSQRQMKLFRFIAVLLPFIFLILLEGILHITGYGENLKLFISGPVEGYEKYMMVNPEIGKKYFQKLEYTSPANDIFLKEKPANTFRVFVMGSSVVYGFPYDRNLMFSRILHKQLADAWPDKDFEVVNTSITAINSFTLLDFTDEILKYAPDAILIYEGHNEFYGAFGIGSNETMSRNRFLVKTHLFLMNSRLYQLMRNTITGTASMLFKSKDKAGAGTLMKRIVADTDILLHSEAYSITMERYSQNMGDILEKAAKKNVPVFFSELVSNINGMEPFNSIATDTLEAAIDVYKRARLAEENQDFDLALELYYRAKDLDCLRFRASEDINSIINDLSLQYKVYRVPMLEHFQTQSPNQLIGNNYMTEHVHPNIDGSFLMADAFFKSIEQSGILGEKSIYSHSIDYLKQNWGYTTLDRLLAHHRVQVLMGHWPFVTNEDESFDHLKQHRPRTYLDSLAFSLLKNPDLSLIETRLALAKRYDEAGKTHLAYKEYEALIRMNPYLAINYRDAATALLKLGDLPLALDYLLTSLQYDESFFARFRIAEIYMIMGDYNNAIRFWDDAYDIAPDDRKNSILGKWYAALVYANKMDEAKVVAAELERLKANQFLRIPPKTYSFEAYIPFQTKEQVEEARLLIDKGENADAINLLESSLGIYDSHIANRLLGELYLKLENHEKSQFYHLKVYKLFRFDPRFLHNLVMINLTQNNMAEARKYLDEIRAVDPGYPQLRLLSMLVL
jgi:tetratricopeptide (TPR) repeat protein